jgi:Trp operon repressor
MAQQIQIRRDGSTDWIAANPVLGQGEIGLELDTFQFKFGDGGTAWNNLPYYSPTIVTWGTIVGTLSNQTDVQLALDAKQDAIANSDDITEGLVNLFLTTSERTKLGNTSGINTGDQDLSSYATLTNLSDGLDTKQNVIVSSDDITEGLTNLFLTPAERTILGNTSGTNTGDQDLSGYATTSALNLKADLSGATFTGAISATNLSGTNTGDQTNITGNAGTATALQTARSINGVSFNGTADITVTDATKLSLAGGVMSGSLSGFKGSTNIQTGTSYTIQASDCGRVITFNNASTITVTVPSGLGADFNCNLIQIGVGGVVVVGSGATVNTFTGNPQLLGQWSSAFLYAVSANVFMLGGQTQ